MRSPQRWISSWPKASWNSFRICRDELGVSYLFITHDLATVKAVADEIVVMLQGEIVEQGRKRDILTPPHHAYTDLLLASVPEMDPDWLDKHLKARQEVSDPTPPSPSS